jgi:hypothetical protein
MTTDNRESQDFIAYPTNRVVGTIANASNARAAVDGLAAAGFAPAEIDVLHGEQDLYRLDPTGEEHGFLARFQRTLIRTAAPVEEYKHLSRHFEDIRAGRFVVMVLAKDHARRERAADILSSHGAEFIGFYGRWAYQAFEDAQSESQHASREPMLGQTYELRLDDMVCHVRLESECAAAVSDPQWSTPELRANVTGIAPGIFMLSWQKTSESAPIVRIADLAHGAAYAVLRRPDGVVQHVTGTIRRV